MTAATAVAAEPVEIGPTGDDPDETQCEHEETKVELRSRTRDRTAGHHRCDQADRTRTVTLSGQVLGVSSRLRRRPRQTAKRGVRILIVAVARARVRLKSGQARQEPVDVSEVVRADFRQTGAARVARGDRVALLGGGGRTLLVGAVRTSSSGEGAERRIRDNQQSVVV